ncbi:MAG TPA: cobalt ECF transporter T component CbiQ, partial [Cyanobacteria bacterium UBA8530]|nr:cobalt ECF transporter T component CbiQ [Cyanobacteria bacterium UBA8530]
MIRQIDGFAHTNRLRNRHAAEKALFSGGMMVLAIALPGVASELVVLLSMAIATLGVARIPLRQYLPVLFLPLTFLLLGLPPFLVSLSPDFQLSLVPNGGWLALQVSLRMSACISCLLFLALTTPVPELLELLRSCRLPPTVIEVALLTYRFLFAFSETAQTIYRAQCLRLGYRTFRNGLRSAAMLVSSILILALERARALERGLAARGYGG